MGPFLVILCQLIMTVLIEGSVMIVWQNTKESLGYSVLANLMTNPLLNLILILISGQAGGPGGFFAIRIALEIGAVLAEAFAYKGMMKLEIKKALWLSLVLNLFSFCIGEIFGVLGYWQLLGVIMEL